MALGRSLGQLSLIVVGFVLITGAMWLQVQSVSQLLIYFCGISGAVSALGGFYWVHLENRNVAWSPTKKIRVGLGILVAFPGSLAVTLGIGGVVLTQNKLFAAVLVVVGLALMGIGYVIGGDEAVELVSFY